MTTENSIGEVKDEIKAGPRIPIPLRFHPSPRSRPRCPAPLFSSARGVLPFSSRRSPFRLPGPMEAVPEFPFSLSLCEPRENERDVRGPLTRSVFRQSARATATPDGSQIGVQDRGASLAEGMTQRYARRIPAVERSSGPTRRERKKKTRRKNAKLMSEIDRKGGSRTRSRRPEGRKNVKGNGNGIGV